MQIMAIKSWSSLGPNMARAWKEWQKVQAEQTRVDFDQVFHGYLAEKILDVFSGSHNR